MKIAVTGPLSYTGRYATRRLLARGADVVGLTGHPDRPDPFGGHIPIHRLQFADVALLERTLRGCEVLVNTYWIRFDRGRNTQERAVENTRRLTTAARNAGIRRVVHVSITNPSLNSRLPYFRGKAQNEQSVISSGLTYAILRPTVLFGKEDVLINNIAFLLRRFPFFLVPGRGDYRLQPVYVDDLAGLIEAAVEASDSYVCDAVGPEVFTFRQLVQLIGTTVGHPRPIFAAPPALLHLAARVLGMLFQDVVLTRPEIDGLMANLLVSTAPPLCRTPLSEWLKENCATVGMNYASELRRHYD